MGKTVKAVAFLRGQLPSREWVYPGDEFEIDESMVSKRWMRIVEERKKPGRPPKSEADKVAEPTGEE